MNSISNQFSSIEQIQNQFLNNKTVKNNVQSSDVSFGSILKEKSSDAVKFSKHASMRLNSRGINLTKEQSDRLENAS